MRCSVGASATIPQVARVGPGTMVGVAQLVEPLVVVQDVAGSSPVTHPKVRRESAGRGPNVVCESLRVRSPWLRDLRVGIPVWRISV